MKKQRHDPMAATSRPSGWVYTWFSDPGTPVAPISRDERPWPEALAAANARPTKPLFPSKFTRSDLPF